MLHSHSTCCLTSLWPLTPPAAPGAAAAAHAHPAMLHRLHEPLQQGGSSAASRRSEASKGGTLCRRSPQARTGPKRPNVAASSSAPAPATRLTPGKARRPALRREAPAHMRRQHARGRSQGISSSVMPPSLGSNSRTCAAPAGLLPTSLASRASFPAGRLFHSPQTSTPRVAQPTEHASCGRQGTSSSLHTPLSTAVTACDVTGSHPWRCLEWQRLVGHNCLSPKCTRQPRYRAAPHAWEQ